LSSTSGHIIGLIIRKNKIPQKDSIFITSQLFSSLPS